MNEKRPKVSVGLAVYNGDNFLERAIDSILSQTFTDFELILSDNASTDRTEEICRKYAAQDQRVRYHRNPTNIGGANNENQTFKMARGEYFRWAAHDDVCAPELIEKCVNVLDNDPSVVLCYSKIAKIDESDRLIVILDEIKAASEKPSERISDLMFLTHDCETTYGLIRSAVMARTGLQLNYTDSDRTFLCELSLYGRFHLIPEVLFYKRVHSGMSTLMFPDWHARMAWFYPEHNQKAYYPHWSQFRHYFQIISSTPLPLIERLRCYFWLNIWLIRYRRFWSMIKEVWTGIKLSFSMS